MLSLAVMLLSVAIITGFKGEIREKVRGYLSDIRIFKYDLNNSFESTPFTLDRQTISALKSNLEIENFHSYATKPAIISVNGEVEGINLKGVGPDFHWDFIQKNLKEGRIIQFADSAKSSQEILISRYTAKRLKLKPGDSFLIYFVQNPPRKRKLTVVGIYDIGIDVIDKGFAIGSLDLIRRINNWGPHEIGGIEIRLKDFSRLSEVSTRIDDDLKVDLQSQSVEQYFPGIFVWLDLLNVNTKILLILMLIVGVINMVTALLIMILERTNMIGMLKAFGAGNATIMRVFLYNAAYLIGIGLLLGNLLGLGLIYLQQKTQLFKLAEDSYYLSHVPVEIHLQEVLLLNLATLLVCLTVLVVPSLLVARISPLKAIRFK